MKTYQMKDLRAGKYVLCKECGQPLLPKGTVKKPNEYDHASGCPAIARNVGE